MSISSRTHRKTFSCAGFAQAGRVCPFRALFGQFVGSSGVDRVFLVGAAALIGVISGATGGGRMICSAGRSASMLGVLADSFGGHRAISDFWA